MSEGWPTPPRSPLPPLRDGGSQRSRDGTVSTKQDMAFDARSRRRFTRHGTEFAFETHRMEEVSVEELRASSLRAAARRPPPPQPLPPGAAAGAIWARSFRRLPRFYINLFSGAAAGERGREHRDGADECQRVGV